MVSGTQGSPEHETQAPPSGTRRPCLSVLQTQAWPVGVCPCIGWMRVPLQSVRLSLQTHVEPPPCSCLRSSTGRQFFPLTPPPHPVDFVGRSHLAPASAKSVWCEFQGQANLAFHHWLKREQTNLSLDLAASSTKNTEEPLLQ